MSTPAFNFSRRAFNPATKCRGGEVLTIGSLNKDVPVTMGGGGVSQGVRVLVGVDLASDFIIHHHILPEAPRAFTVEEVKRFIRLVLKKAGRAPREVLLSKSVWMSAAELRKDPEALANELASATADYLGWTQDDRIALIKWGRDRGQSIDFNGDDESYGVVYPGQ